MMVHLIYGGSGSGKSSFAENRLVDAGRTGAPLAYIATMLPADAEARMRIARHQAERANKGFVTIERYTDLENLEIADGSLVLLECLGNLVANELFYPGGAGKDTITAVMRGIDNLERRAGGLFVVSNDVFSDGVEYSREVREYCDTLAALHRHLAARAVVVVETVCGIPIHHKRESTLP